MKEKTAALALVSLALVPSAVRAQQRTLNVSLSATSAAAGLLVPEEREARRTLLVDRASRATVVVSSPVDFQAVVRLSDGRRISAANADDRGRAFAFELREQPDLLLPGVGRGHNLVVTLDQPPPGELEVQLAAAQPMTATSPFTITLLQESEVRLGLALPSTDVGPGEAIVVTALLFDKQKPVRAAEITASLLDAEGGRAGETSLRDDGRVGDVKARDGCYTGLLVPERPGRHVVAVRARGRTQGGLRFERHAGAPVEVGTR